MHVDVAADIHPLLWCVLSSVRVYRVGVSSSTHTCAPPTARRGCLGEERSRSARQRGLRIQKTNSLSARKSQELSGNISGFWSRSGGLLLPAVMEDKSGDILGFIEEVKLNKGLVSKFSQSAVHNVTVPLVLFLCWSAILPAVLLSVPAEWYREHKNGQLDMQPGALLTLQKHAVSCKQKLRISPSWGTPPRSRGSV